MARRRSSQITTANHAVLYMRVSTTEQAQRHLSIPAQRKQLRNYARAHGLTVAEEFVEPGKSGRDANRPEFNRMIERALAPSSTVGVVLVWSTSRFMRNAFEARAYKEKLARRGVRVIAVTQETADDEYGRFTDGIFELVDQLESDVNGKRTRAAMRECAEQGFYPGWRAPYGFKIEKVGYAPGVKRNKLVPNPAEAAIYREIFELYVGGCGAKTVASQLNERGHFYRKRPWDKDLVLKVVSEEAAIGTYYWGRVDSKTKLTRPREDWIAIPTEPIIDSELFELAQNQRERNSPAQAPGRTSSSPLLLAGLAVCGKCKASYQLETSGKLAPSGERPYRYYNCRTTLRTGKETCEGHRIKVETLELAVLSHLADRLFTLDRCRSLLRELAEQSGVLRDRAAEKRKEIKRDLEKVEQGIRRWEAAFESGDLDPSLGAGRLRELQDRRVELEGTLARQVHHAPPPNLYTEANIRRFQTNLRNAFLGDDRALAKAYLNLLVERVEILDAEITIIARPHGALALLAAPKTPETLVDAKKTEVEAGCKPVLTSVLGELRQQDLKLPDAELNPTHQAQRGFAFPAKTGSQQMLGARLAIGWSVGWKRAA
jgi:site-specific DNA recombinase